jgi:murein DD-endopeptidase MepM/ murein hydrolase activator NlpD
VKPLAAAFLAVSTVAAATAWPGSAHAEEPANIPQNFLAPTDWGAPFLPSKDHTSSVVQRAELLTSIDTITEAHVSLRGRSAAGTSRILESQEASLNRELESVPVVALANTTEEFGIDVGVFPVAELRKPFRNDWDEARSGGRRHRGTDLLAQMGVPLLAIEDGTFERNTLGSSGGLSVYLIGDSGARYYYAHLDQAEEMLEGQRVYAGQQIGTVGDSGNAKGSPHLHIQWAPNGDSDWANPFPLLDALYGDGHVTVTAIEGPPNQQP